MTIHIDNESTQQVDFDYNKLIESTILKCLDYEKCPYEAEISILLTDDNEIKEINKQYRGIDAATDVLSFPAIEYGTPGDFSDLKKSEEEYFNPDTGELILGDIVISVERAIKQAEEYGHSLKREIAFLTAHSMFHLMGYDHMTDDERTIMEAKQKEVLDLLNISR